VAYYIGVLYSRNSVVTYRLDFDYDHLKVDISAPASLFEEKRILRQYLILKGSFCLVGSDMLVVSAREQLSRKKGKRYRLFFFFDISSYPWKQCRVPMKITLSSEFYSKFLHAYYNGNVYAFCLHYYANTHKYLKQFSNLLRLDWTTNASTDLVTQNSPPCIGITNETRLLVSAFKCLSTKYWIVHFSRIPMKVGL
jgi:hypothetical protein